MKNNLLSYLYLSGFICGVLFSRNDRDLEIFGKKVFFFPGGTTCDPSCCSGLQIFFQIPTGSSSNVIENRFLVKVGSFLVGNIV